MLRHPRLLVLTLTVGVMVALVAVAGGHGRSPHERSDRFWSALFVRGAEAEHYDSLEAISLSADLIVIATIGSVEVGQSVGNDEDGWAHYAALTLDVETVIGSASGATPSTLHVQQLMPSDRSITTLSGTVPEERAVWFLRDRDAEAARLNLPADVVARVQGQYRLAVREGVVREMGGRVHLPVGPLSPAYASWEGRDFEEFANQVEAFAQQY